jgi:hypothetical protein
MSAPHSPTLGKMKPNLALGGGQPHVRGQGDHRAGADHRAVDRGDHRALAAADRGDQPTGRAREGEQLRRRWPSRWWMMSS